MKTNILDVKIVNKYSRDLIYPVNHAAEVFAKIAGTVTLTPATLRHARELGYTVNVITPTLEV